MFRRNSFSKISLAIVIITVLLTRKALALNQIGNSNFTGNANQWVTQNKDGFGPVGATTCGETSTSTADTAWDTIGYFSNMGRGNMTNTGTVAERGYFRQTFAAPGTGSVNAYGSTTFQVTGNSFGAANTSWVRMDIVNLNLSFVGTLTCRSFNAVTGTTTIGSDRVVTLTGGNIYYLIVTMRLQNAATNPSNESVRIDNVGISTGPTNFATSSQAGTTSPMLTWDASTATTSARALHASTPYKVYRGTVSGGETFLANATTTTYWDASAKTGNTVYYYWVTNVDAGGWESASSTEKSWLTAPDVPGTPTFSNITQNSMRVSWTEPNGAASYNIDRCQGSGCSSFVTIATGVTDLFYDDSGLNLNSTYGYRVSATNSSGTTASSTAAFQATGVSAFKSKINMPPNYLALGSGLLAYWTFDGKTLLTDIADSSGNGRDLLWSGGATTTVIGKIGQALLFNGTSNFAGGAGVGTTAPSVADYQQSDWTDVVSGSGASEVTPTLTWSSGDVILVVGGTENGNTQLGVPTATGLSFSLIDESNPTHSASQANTYAWSATAGSNGSSAITSGRLDAVTGAAGISAFVYHGTNGLGNNNILHASSATVTSLTRRSSGSAVATVLVDWNTGNDDVVDPDPAGGTQRVAQITGSSDTNFVFNWGDQGAAGTTNYGIANFGFTPMMDGVVVEILGTASAGGQSISGVKTVSFWVKPTSTTQSVMDMDGTKNIDISGGTVRANNFTGATIYVDGVQTSTFPNTEWHQVTITASTAVDATSFTLGKVGAAFFSGRLDDVRLYDRVLSASEITNLYNVGKIKVGVSPSTGSGPLSSGLVGYWPFDGKTMYQNISDLSGNGNTLNWFGGSTTTVPGKIGQALSFDGSANYAKSVNNFSPASDKISVSFWYNTPSYSDVTDAIVLELSTNAGTSNNAFFINSSCASTCTGRFSALLSGSSGILVKSFTRPSTGTWHHYVFVFDNTTATGDIAVYVDGVSQSLTTDITTKSGTGNFTPGPLHMMSRAGTTLFNKGYLDDVRIYDHVLTAAEILQLYRFGQVKVRK